MYHYFNNKSIIFYHFININIYQFNGYIYTSIINITFIYGFVLFLHFD
jgi:hypothetical protein